MTLFHLFYITDVKVFLVSYLFLVFVMCYDYASQVSRDCEIAYLSQLTLATLFKYPLRFSSCCT